MYSQDCSNFTKVLDVP